MIDDVRIIPLSESSVVVEFGRTISLKLNQKAIALAKSLNSSPFLGMIEAAPAYASTSVFFDVSRIQTEFPHIDPHQFVSDQIRTCLQVLVELDDQRPETIEIAFAVDEGEFDLAFVAERTKMSKSDVIELFTASEYRVFMLGFLPGFPYMGILDERLALPRRDVPRTRVPVGSVAVAGQQVGIYPQDSPGGWHIIGKTSARMFDPDNLALLEPGMNVRFLAE